MSCALVKIMEGTTASVPPQGGRKHPQQEFLQVDTTNILFICGGAFSGLEKIIADRLQKRSIGFGAHVADPDKRRVGELLQKAEPEDLLKFGLIPEFVGRLPVIATLEDLDITALVKILSEPKNALVKQFQKLFDLEDVVLTFTSDALETIAKKAIERKTGARAACVRLSRASCSIPCSTCRPPKAWPKSLSTATWSKGARRRCRCSRARKRRRSFPSYASS